MTVFMLNLIAFLTIVGSVITVLQIGKYREPITAPVATIIVAINAVFTVFLFRAAYLLGVLQ